MEGKDSKWQATMENILLALNSATRRRRAGFVANQNQESARF